jgi:ribosylpyrimidine nucleosidase
MLTFENLCCLCGAGALEADPALVRSRIKNVVVMGGAARVSPSAWHDHAYYTQGGAEFNFYFDSQAAYKVIHSGLEVILIGLEVANADVCSSQELRKLVSAHLDKKEGAVTSPAWLLRTLLVAFDLSLSYAAVAAFQLVHPEYFRLEKVWVSVDPHSGKLTEAVCVLVLYTNHVIL